MRAVLCHAHGEPESLSLETIPDPRPTAGEVLVDIHATGVNFPDCLMIQGKYQSQPQMPFSPGGEIAGRIREIGANVTGWNVGDAIIAGTGHGGFAERAVVQPHQMRTVPEGMDLTTAAGFSTTYGTSYYALKHRARLQPEETLLVLGAAGGVGLAAVELGKSMGARVIAAASTEEKLQVAARAGADAGIDYGKGDLRQQLGQITGGKGVDVIYDPVGGELFDPCLRSMNWNGRLLVIGFASGTIPRAKVNLVLLKSCQIVGVFYGAFSAREPEEHARLLTELDELFIAGKIRPLVGQTFALDQYAEALRCLMNRSAMGKVIVQPGRLS